MKFAVAETNGHLARRAGEEAAAKPLALHLVAHDFDSTATTQAAIALLVQREEREFSALVVSQSS